MGIESTQGPCAPDTDFEDQQRNQSPVTSAFSSALALLRFRVAFLAVQAHAQETGANKQRRWTMTTDRRTAPIGCIPAARDDKIELNRKSDPGQPNS